MSNYTKTTDFEAKDSLPSGDSGKIIKGAEFETEFDNIATAVATKADTAGPTFTGTLTYATLNDGTTALTSTVAELNILDGVTSTAAELNILDGVTSTAAELNILDGVTSTAAELNILDGVTSTTAELNILDGVTSTTAELNILDGVTSSTAELNILDGVTSTTAELNILDGVTSTASELNILDGVTSTTAELNLVDGSSAGTIVNSKALIYGSSGEVNATTLQIAGSSITATAAELNILDGVTSTAAELNILDGVTSTTAELNILDGVTATAAELNILDGATSTAAELNKLDGVSTLKQAGKETMWVPATAMYPNTTQGCSALAQVELSNGPELKCLDFADGEDDHAQFTVAFPKSWNEGVVQFQAFWTVTGTNTGTVAWGLSGVSFANSADMNHSDGFGTNVVATALAHSGTSNDMMVSAVSGDVTIRNAAVDTMTVFQVMRDISADTQTGDARLLGIKLFFTTDAANDA